MDAEDDPRPSSGRWPLRLERARPSERRLVEPGADSAIRHEPRGPAAPRPAWAVRQPLVSAPAAPGSARDRMLRPQQPLSDAQRDAQRARRAPALPASDGAALRQHMVERLRQAGCRDEAVLAAMGQVPRHLFVDAALRVQAYEDTSLPIGLGQTISKPSVVARMIELLRERPGGPALRRVLEIGSGCGYQAAVLAALAERVVSIERLRGLHERALQHLAPMGLVHLQLVFGDGRLGHAPAAPYDAIIAAAGGHELPAAWLDQLARGGRLVAPVHDAALGSQVLMVVDRLADGRIVQRVHEPVRFVPLESGISEFGHS